MPVFDGFRLEPLPQRWQEEANNWQDTYFPELPEVVDVHNWQRLYPHLHPTNLSVIWARPDAFATFAFKIVGLAQEAAD
jgi:hypothetical protein